jgi:dipeptidyl aminopeptidase/acylaminoacyl peptidase
MHLSNFIFPRPTTVGSLLAALSLILPVSGVSAQKSSPDQKPNVSDKALITKQTPDPKKKPAESGAVKQYTIEQFMATIRLGGASFSSDEKSILFHSNKSGIFNVYAMAVTGGEAKQLTNSTKESTYAVSYFPADGRFLYRYDKGGNENDHLYLRELDGKETDLTPGEKTKAQFYGWSQDRKSFFFGTNTRDPKFFDVFEMNVADLKPTLIYKDESGYILGDISGDRKFLAFGKPGASTADSDVYLYNTGTKEMKNITAHTGDVENNPETFDPASRFLYYLSDEGTEFKGIVRYDLASGEKAPMAKSNWDVSFVTFSHNGKYRAVGTNEDARTKVTVYEGATDKVVPLPPLPEGDITAVKFSESENKLAFYHDGARSPANLYVYDFATQKPLKLTESLSPEINAADLVDSRVIRYKSFDGTEIPAILYQPRGATAQKKAPAIVRVHGGPGGQARMPYSAGVQFLVNHGYVVLDVNNRGSSGYGKTFFKADDQKHGREPLWDCVEAKKYLQTLDYVDGGKIAIMGGSYGGYMVLAALAFKPEEFNAGVDIFGVSNWVRTLEQIPPYWEAERKSLYAEIGDPTTQADMLREISPLFHADKITKPLLVLQGANDPRVLKKESDEIVDAIKKKGGVVEYVVFDNEGHGFTKKANEIRGNKATLDFLDKYLKGSAPAAAN